jgi:hypothetical protein
MDRLEMIALTQVSNNLEFRDYYKMVEGRLVYSDFEAPPEITKDIATLRQEMDLPTYLRHYDIIGVVANLLTGELDNNKDKLRVDSIDEYSQNEYIRERSSRINEYMKQKFDMEVRRGLAMKGINPDANIQFQSEEEQQQYMQMLQAEAAKIVNPEHIEKELSKSFKVKAAEWGEATLEADTERFGLDYLEEQEFMDYFLTGRYFRHYQIGYDFYKPERWRVEQVFFSQDLDIEYPQDGEYVGRLTWMSASEIISRWGEKLSLKIQEQLGKVYDNTKGQDGGQKSDFTTKLQRPVGSDTVPHQDYYDQQLTLQLQEAFGVPAGMSTYIDESGQVKTAPDWLSGYTTNEAFFGSRYAQNLRNDIEVRRDLFRVTEAYFRSYKRVGYLRYQSPTGIIAEELVTDDLLKDFIKENNIKQMKSISLEDFEKGDEVNVIAYFYVPEIWSGKKISAAGGLGSQEIIFDVKPLEFQIKGESNIFDVKLPVSGIITSSYARRLRPYQMGYNICMNQIFNLLEKEIGMFFLMDINFLPSEFKDMGDSAELLAQLREMARDLGFLPVDTSRQNMAGTNPQAGYFQKQDISYDVQINRRAVMAEMYKRLALEQIGITEQRKGTPDQYATAEGIRVGQEASYAQTRTIYSKFNEARKKTAILHLNVAQFCQGENKDITVFSRRSDGDIAFLEFSDELFPLRQLGITAVSDSKARKSLENLRQFMMQNNTAGSDILDFAQIMTADSMVEMIDIGRRSRLKQQQDKQEERQHEEKLLQMELDAKKEEKANDQAILEQSKERDREMRVQVAEIQALGRASDKQSDQAGIAAIKEAADQAFQERKHDDEMGLKEVEQEMKQQQMQQTNKLQEAELRLKLEELREKRAQRRSEDMRAVINKN